MTTSGFHGKPGHRLVILGENFVKGDVPTQLNKLSKIALSITYYNMQT